VADPARMPNRSPVFIGLIVSPSGLIGLFRAGRGVCVSRAPERVELARHSAVRDPWNGQRARAVSPGRAETRLDERSASFEIGSAIFDPTGRRNRVVSVGNGD
jgi:hypothetical protein